MDLGFISPEMGRWAWPKSTFQPDLFEKYGRFLRYPGPEQGLGYRLTRVGVIAALRVIKPFNS